MDIIPFNIIHKSPLVQIPSPFSFQVIEMSNEIGLVLDGSEAHPAESETGNMDSNTIGCGPQLELGDTQEIEIEDEETEMSSEIGPVMDGSETTSAESETGSMDSNSVGLGTQDVLSDTEEIEDSVTEDGSEAPSTESETGTQMELSDTQESEDEGAKMSSEVVPVLDGSTAPSPSAESETRDTQDFPSFDDMVNLCANFQVNLIGPNHEMNLFLSPEKGHKYITQSNPTPASLKTLLEMMKEPSVLQLRGCNQLLPISDFPFEKFNTITSLEISGVTHLVNLPQETISAMFQLQSLTLSHLPIQQLPQRLFTNLTDLRSLVLKGCPNLTSLPAIDGLFKLQYIEISHLPIEEFDSEFFLRVFKLRSVIFRGCSKLRVLPGVCFLNSLEVLDVSHCTVLQNQDFNSLSSECLKMVDLSYTALREPFSVIYCDTLTHLFLRNTNVGCFTDARNLQVLDLSGAPNLREIDWIQANKHLICLDLSRTNIESIDSLSSLIHLRSLILRECTGLVKLPAMLGWTSLEVLDISGCEILEDLPEGLTNLTNLKELNLSGCSCLQDLREGLFDQMSSLEKLDLSKTQFNQHFPSFANLTNLQILNLSQTSVANLLGVSKLVNLKELLLANCQQLQVLPDVQALTNLKTLDLSLPNYDYTTNHFQVEAKFDSQRAQFFSDPSRLQKLVLANRPSVLQLFPEVSPGDNLQYLDLRGIDVIGVHSSGKENLQEAVGWNADIHLSLVQREISKCDEIHLVSTFLSISSDFDRFRRVFSELEDSILKIQKKFIPASPDTVVAATCNSSNKGIIRIEVFKRNFGSIRDDLKYIKKSIGLLESSVVNCQSSEKLLHELLDIATHLSEVDSPVLDYTKLNELLRIVAKLKLLVPPPRQVDDQERMTQSSRENFDWSSYNPFVMVSEEEIQKAYASLKEIERNCLLYFSIFPCSVEANGLNEILKHSRIQKRVLIQWWIGEGLFDPHHEENPNSTPMRVPQHASTSKGVEKVETVEEIAKQILKVLQDKKLILSLLSLGWGWDSGSCYMLPSVHSFVTRRAIEEGFFDFSDLTGSQSQRIRLLKSQDNIPSSCRLWASYAKSSQELERFKTKSALFNINETMIDIKVKWFSKMRNLLVLHLGNLGHTDVEHIEVKDFKFLEELKNMKQLRILSLEGFPTLTKLPDSVCELSNLKILNLRDCGYLEELPAGIGSLKNLTHLDVTDSRILSMLPKGISLLSKLEVLKGFNIYYQVGGQQHRNACTLRDLLKLKNLRKLNLVVNRDKFPESSDLQVLKEMKNLCNLQITWEKNCNTDEDRHDVVGQEALKQYSRWKQLKCWEQQTRQMDIEEPVRSNRLGNLRKLVLCCLPLKTLPDWLDPSEMRNLERLYITGGNLTTFRAGTNHITWNVEILRLKRLRHMSMDWEDLRRIFSNMTHFFQDNFAVKGCPSLQVIHVK